MPSKVTKSKPKAKSARTSTPSRATSRTATKMADDKSTFTGGCHCGNIKYQVSIPTPTDSSPLNVTRCNCTFCQKPGMTNLSIKEPDTNFKLLSPADKSKMGNYQPNTKTVNKHFCADCGVHVYQEGFYEIQGTKHDLFVVNVQTLDQPQDGLDLSKVKVQYFDMLNSNWMGGLKDVPWPHGLP